MIDAQEIIHNSRDHIDNSVIPDYTIGDIGGEIINLPSSSFIFIDYDSSFHNRNDELPDEIIHLIEDKNIHTIVPEYFSPKIDKSFRSIPLIGNRLADTYWNENSVQYNDLISRCVVSKKICDLAASHGKNIAVMDIANNPISYTVNMALHTGIVPTKIARDIATILGQNYGLDSNQLMLASTLAAPLGMIPFAIKTYLLSNNLGIFDRDTISKFEKFVYDIEDARRVIIAKSLVKIDSISKDESTEPTILYVLPKAHRIRIAKMITERNKPTSNLNFKFNLYKSTLLGVHPAIEYWNYQEDNWRLTHKIPV